ncbi:MAG: DNA-binding response OmpR family regulator [Phenylobacterium sp.]
MTSKLRVLSIDDNHQNLSLIQQALEEHFDVVSSSGEEPIDELVLDCEPNIILLDIMLADTSGYDICRSIRQLEQARRIIVVFISSLHSLDDKLKAYEAGGDDYICKPVNLDELVYKLEVYEKRIFEQHHLEHQAEEAAAAALTSKQQSSEQGLLIAFITQSLSLVTLDDLYTATHNIITNFGLKFAIEFRANNDVIQYPKNQVSQLESEILGLGTRAKRIVPFGHNRLFNSRQCSLLVKKMPDETALSARVQDHLSIMLDIINSRIVFIQSEQNRQFERQKAIDAIKANVARNMSTVSNNVDQVASKLELIFAELQHSLKHDNLNNQNTINAILDRTQQQFDGILKTSIDIDDNMHHIGRLLNNIT